MEEKTFTQHAKEELTKITKTKLTFLIIDTVLILTLLIFVIYAQIQGKYTNTNIVTIETCQGQPTTEGIQTLQKLGYKTEEIQEERKNENENRNNYSNVR